MQGGWRYVFCRRHLAPYSAMNLHIYPSTSGLLWGRRGKDGDSAACRKNAGWPGSSSMQSSDGCVRLIPWRGRAVCFQQRTRLKDVLGMHKY